MRVHPSHQTALTALVLGLSACATTPTATTDPTSIATAARALDVAIEETLLARLGRANTEGFAGVKVASYGPGLLLYGCVPSEEHREATAMMAWAVTPPTTNDIYNEIFVEDVCFDAQRDGFDALTRARIFERFRGFGSLTPLDARTLRELLRAYNIEIESAPQREPELGFEDVEVHVFRGTVYLIGWVPNELALQRSAEMASAIDGVRRVVSFVRTNAPETSPR